MHPEIETHLRSLSLTRSYPSYYKPRVCGANKLYHFYECYKSISKIPNFGKLGQPRPASSYRGQRRNKYFGRPIPKPSLYREQRKAVLRERCGQLFENPTIRHRIRI